MTDRHQKQYNETWGSKIGRDCIDFDQSLCRWLGERLSFLAQHANSCPAHAELYPPNMPTSEHFSHWQAQLKHHGAALLIYAEHGTEKDDATQNAQEALKFIADHLKVLWD